MEYKQQGQVDVDFPDKIQVQDEVWEKSINILSIYSNKIETLIGVLVGHKMFHDESLSYFLFIYERGSHTNEWNVKKTVHLPETLRRVCPQFEFLNKSNDEVVFTTQN